jgi:hypothetical protein
MGNIYYDGTRSGYVRLPDRTLADVHVTNQKQSEYAAPEQRSSKLAKILLWIGGLSTIGLLITFIVDMPDQYVTLGQL